MPIWRHLWFMLRLADIGDLLVERGIEVIYEAIRTWMQKFGAKFARKLRDSRSRAAGWRIMERRP
jgi:putative transposase